MPPRRISRSSLETGVSCSSGASGPNRKQDSDGLSAERDRGVRVGCKPALPLHEDSEAEDTSSAPFSSDTRDAHDRTWKRKRTARSTAAREDFRPIFDERVQSTCPLFVVDEIRLSKSAVD